MERGNAELQNKGESQERLPNHQAYGRGGTKDKGTAKESQA
jgi:hypothetical protein